MKIEEINSVEDFDGYICFTSSMDSTFLVATYDSALQDWVLDSRASFHVTPHREWFVTFDAAHKGHVQLGNGYPCDILGVGDVQIKFQNGSSFTLKNVRYVPKLTKSLISIGQLDDTGFHCIFGESSWKITKGSLVVAHGAKSGTLYMLHVSNIKNHVICVIEQPSVLCGIAGWVICLRKE